MRLLISKANNNQRSETNEHAEKAIKPETVSEATDIDSAGAAFGTVATQTALSDLSRERRDELAQALLDRLHVANEHTLAQAAQANAEADLTREQARAMKLANEMNETLSPFFIVASKITFVVALLLTGGGIYLTFIDMLSYVRGEERRLFWWWGPMLTGLGVVFLFGHRYLPALLSAISARKPGQR